jgi:hypothetical protein
VVDDKAGRLEIEAISRTGRVERPVLIQPSRTGPAGSVVNGFSARKTYLYYLTLMSFDEAGAEDSWYGSACQRISLDPSRVTFAEKKLWAQLLVNSYPEDLSFLEDLLERLDAHSPNEAVRFERDYWKGVIDDAFNEGTREMEIVKARSGVAANGDEARNVKYRIGQVVQHRQHLYRGVIYSWDTECLAHQGWVAHM